MKVIKVKSEQDVIEELAKLVESTANEAIKRNGKFRVGLSGGSLVKYLCNGLPSISTDWTLWQLFFCDERFVPDSDIDSTFGAYKDLLVKKVQLSAEQFVQINIDLPLDKCAQDYEERIRALLAGVDVYQSAIVYFIKPKLDVSTIISESRHIYSPI